MKENKIEKVDLLKIDTEGNEKKVLVGSEDFINPSIIKSVQFEYGGTYLDAGITLAEVVQLLMEKKYFVGKLFADHIKYEADLGNFVEDYAYGNFVASDKKSIKHDWCFSTRKNGKSNVSICIWFYCC
ncbi:MAG: FkbM family methyltransferase [Bacteroidetes bacterium]|nr:FkbM family methyltransferase [Bacteroidota bacterium]